ncbi:MAG: hypothetical protein WB715_18200 [Roseiarcus sp.]|uniref:hypothetical protein n=1 Tax=Roseiarcus sp. TaxID=1969460 RepID=UPI003C4CDDF2
MRFEILLSLIVLLLPAAGLADAPNPAAMVPVDQAQARECFTKNGIDPLHFTDMTKEKAKSLYDCIHNAGVSTSSSQPPWHAPPELIAKTEKVKQCVRDGGGDPSILAGKIKLSDQMKALVSNCENSQGMTPPSDEARRIPSAIQNAPTRNPH